MFQGMKTLLVKLRTSSRANEVKKKVIHAARELLPAGASPDGALLLYALALGSIIYFLSHTS
jgi:hypothetical protein